MRARFPLLALLLMVAFFARPAKAQSLLGNPQVTYQFGKFISFQIVVDSKMPVEGATLFFSSAGEVKTETRPVDVSTAGPDRYLLSYRYDLNERPLRAFATVTYRFEVEFAGGKVLQSENYQFHYEDNRFEWRTLEEPPFRVHWVNGNLAFAQNVLDVAQAGQERVEKLLSLATANPVEIYLYNSSAELQDTLTLAGQKWVAGHADPDLGVMVVALPPGPDQRLLMEQRIPHELMHILLYQRVGQSYSNLPIWLNEGLASLAELYPNPDYQILLERALQQDRILPVTSLCRAFPRDASNALLAYAQSDSFTRYLQHTYGANGLQGLLDAYTNGVDCDRGVEVALGKNLAQLEKAWRQASFSENAAAVGLNNLLPWLALLMVPLLGLVAFSLRPFHRQPPDSVFPALNTPPEPRL